MTLPKHMTREDIAVAVSRQTHWYHQIELAPGIVTPGINNCGYVLSTMDLPADLRGKRVLDIGARDGYFSFTCEQRGADVVAVDYMPADATGFGIAASIFDSRVNYVHENIYNLTRERFGTFDIVLMLGLLYHLRDPLGAIDLVRDLCKDRLLLETYVCDDLFALQDGSAESLKSIDPRLERVPLMQFCPGTSLNGDASNFWAPNTACVEAMLREAAFDVRRTVRLGSRSVFDAHIVEDKELLYQRAIARGEDFPRTP
jgi:tRNA (mo5U34)-methyltransferase